MYENLKNINILYIEDDKFVREQTSNLLNAIFNNVYIANDGEEGILQYTKYADELDAIVTDINMPNMTGVEMAKKIHTELEKTPVPIIAVSAYSSEDYGMEEIKENFSYYLRKPIQIKELINTISKALEED